MLNSIPIQQWDVAAGFLRILFGHAHRGRLVVREEVS